VLRPLVSVITNVSFDHMEYLGDTLTKIAGEKGGIIRRGVPCVTASMKKEVVETLRRITKRKATRLIQAKKRVELRAIDSKDGRYVVNPYGVVDLRAKRISITGAKLGLSGVHQAINAATAVAAVDVLMSNRANVKLFPRLNNKAVRRGLENVVENTGFHGRLEPFGKKILLDVAHNREGMETLAASLSPRGRGNLIVVFGVMKDKDYRAMCEIVAGMAKHVVAVQAKNDRALKSSEIAKRINLIGENATNGRSVRRGVEIAMKLAGKKRKVLITGSHYVVGEALEFLQSQ